MEVKGLKQSVWRSGGVKEGGNGFGLVRVLAFHPDLGDCFNPMAMFGNVN